MKLLYSGFIIAILFASCKEQPIQIDIGGNFDNWDTAYISDIETPQAKMYLAEELTGVRCSNCPEGAEFLDQLNVQNDNKFVIVGLHSGALTNPIPGKSTQDFRTNAGDQMRALVFGGEGNKPSVAFDRLPLSTGQNKFFVEGTNNWGQAIVQMKQFANTTPVNIKLNSEYSASEDKYNVEVQLNFTSDVADAIALNIFAIENNIMDGFVESDTPILYNHILREALTPAIGKVILADYPVKKPGLTYIFRTSLKIDLNDAKQARWVPANMKLVAFVSKSTPSDKHVYQVTQTILK